MRPLVLLSGGLDSAVALWWALEEGHDPVALSFLYPDRPLREVQAARDLSSRAGVELIEADLPFLREPIGGRFARAPRGYVPARNAVLYAAALHHAEILDCDAVVGGHNADDATRFPDATPRFFARLERLLHEGLWKEHAGDRPPRLLMPLHHLTKQEVGRLACRLGVPAALSWSCYEDGDVPCGACPSCHERAGVATA